MALKPVYYLYGTEDYLIDEALSSIKREALTGPFASMNYDAFEGKGALASEIINAASTMPAFSDVRLVVVKDAGALKADELSALTAYLQDPNPAACLVFVSDTAKLDRKTDFFKMVLEKGFARACMRLTDDETRAWIRKEAKKQSKEISEGAVRRLLEIVGTGLRDLKCELDKVVLYSGDKASVDESDVEEACMICREETSFNLAKAIAAKNVRSALKIYERLSDEPPLMVLGAIAWQLRMNSKGAKKTELKRSFDLLYGADRALKTSAQPAGVVIPALIIDLCMAGGR